MHSFVERLDQGGLVTSTTPTGAESRYAPSSTSALNAKIATAARALIIDELDFGGTQRGPRFDAVITLIRHAAKRSGPGLTVPRPLSGKRPRQAVTASEAGRHSGGWHIGSERNVDATRPCSGPAPGFGVTRVPGDLVFSCGYAGGRRWARWMYSLLHRRLWFLLPWQDNAAGLPLCDVRRRGLASGCVAYTPLMKFARVVAALCLCGVAASVGQAADPPIHPLRRLPKAHRGADRPAPEEQAPARGTARRGRDRCRTSSQELFGEAQVRLDAARAPVVQIRGFSTSPRRAPSTGAVSPSMMGAGS